MPPLIGTVESDELPVHVTTAGRRVGSSECSRVLESPRQLQKGRPEVWAGGTGTHWSLPACRFPRLFPPLKPETVARRTVEAVQLNQALLLLPWTMHALIILKRYGWGSSG